jgi:transketolase N-terminal domain/subunit
MLTVAARLDDDSALLTWAASLMRAGEIRKEELWSMVDAIDARLDNHPVVQHTLRRVAHSV